MMKNRRARDMRVKAWELRVKQTTDCDAVKMHNSVEVPGAAAAVSALVLNRCRRQRHLGDRRPTAVQDRVAYNASDLTVKRGVVIEPLVCADLHHYYRLAYIPQFVWLRFCVVEWEAL